MIHTLTVPMGLVLPHVQRIDTFYQTLSVPLNPVMMHHHIYEALAEYLYNRLRSARDTDISDIVDMKLAGASLPHECRPAVLNYISEQFASVYVTLASSCQLLLERLEWQSEDIDYLYFAFPVSHDTLFLVFETTPMDEVMHVPTMASVHRGV